MLKRHTQHPISHCKLPDQIRRSAIPCMGLGMRMFAPIAAIVGLAAITGLITPSRATGGDPGPGRSGVAPASVETSARGGFGVSGRAAGAAG